MSGFGKKLKALIPSKRKLIQLYTALLFNINVKGFASGSIYKGASKALCAPGINCYSCPGAVTACPLGSLQGAISKDRSTLYYVGGILLLYCVIFGRFICSWLCPFGLIQELLFKIKTPKLKKSRITRTLSYLKYVILVFFVLIVPITFALRDTPLPAFCKYICPAGTLEGGLTLLANKVNEGYFSMLGPIFTWKFLLMISILTGCVFVFRLFCRFICPLGALYGLFNKVSVFGIKVDQNKCTGCGLCVNRCKMDIRNVGDRECIACGECIGACPTKAIEWKRSFMREDTRAQNADKRLVTRIVSATVLLAVLVGAFFMYWNTDDAENNPGVIDGDSSSFTASGDNKIGTTLELIDGNGATGETVTSPLPGKITVVNFWGTWCGPCVNELPGFDKIAAEYAESVAVIAVHSVASAEDEPAFIAKYYPDSHIIFAVDSIINENNAYSGVYYTELGGRDAYPYTVIFDASGEVVKAYVGPVEYDELKNVLEQLING